jgi:hypothetical protein
MTTTTSPATSPGDAPRKSGWLTFAGTLFILIGAFNVIDGLIALLNDEYFVATEDGLVFADFTAWGWFWLIFGVIQILVGFGILATRGWARGVGVALAMLSAVAHIAYLVAFPIWGLITIGLCVVVIYGLLVPYGDEPPRGYIA